MSFHPLVLDDLRNEAKGRSGKTPFEHQLDAFEAMKKCFDFDKDQGKGGLLVLPTGAGKTFTTVKWFVTMWYLETSGSSGSPIRTTFWIRPSGKFTTTLAGFLNRGRP